MVTELLQPPSDILICLVLANIVDEQRANSAPIVCGGDGAVSLLASCVPNLSLDGFCVHLNGSGSEFDADGRLGVQVELVASESAQKIGFTDARVSDKDNCGGLVWRSQRAAEKRTLEEKLDKGKSVPS
jgi:hypothetical protein